jgi:2-polyprenyl-6-methoxyphenol hydroxylase-like FAD-dependent oxidoreductase
LIPGKGGHTEPGQRLINWVWYCNYPAKSDIYKDLMTDSEGYHHHFTLPVGKIQARLVEQQKGYTSQVLSPQFAELVRQTKTPFVQAITDVISPKADFMDGKLLLVGDAVAGFRPHTAASTNQAAYHALLLENVMKGEISLGEELAAVMEYARHMSEAGKRMGNRSQFSGKDGREEQ